MLGRKVCYAWENSKFIRIDMSRELHGFIERNPGLIREINLYLEISFHEILVQQLGYDPLEFGDNEATDGVGNFNTPNDDHRGEGNDDNGGDGNNNNESDSGSESFFSAVDSDYNMIDDDDNEFHDNVDKTAE